MLQCFLPLQNAESIPSRIYPKVWFLAHLSQRLMGELIVYQSFWRPSANISNIFSSETTKPIKLKIYMETP